MTRLTYIPHRVIDTDGIADGAALYVYETGTTTPISLYSDAACTVPVTNPYVVASGAAVPTLYYNHSGDVRFKVVSNTGEVERDEDPYDPVVLTSDLSSQVTTFAATRTALAAKATDGPVMLTEAGREGIFIFDGSDLSGEITLDPLQGMYVAPSSDTTGASGAWVRQGELVTPFYFGAVGDGTTDDLAAFQAFNDWFFAVARTQYADFTGSFGLSGHLDIGPTAKSSLRWTMGGRPQFTMLNATFECIRMILSNQVFNGFMTVTGIGSTTFASRTCGVGFCLQDCDRMEIDGLRADNFWFSGVTYDGSANSNGAQIGIIKATNCGSGHNYSGAGNGLTGNWSGAANTGSTGSSSQKTTLTVDTLPSADIETYRSVGSQQLHVRINGYLYFVSAIDRSASTITIFPWIDPAAGASGTYEWVFGGGHEPIGSNANVVKVGLLDTIRCGKGAAEAALYCSRYGSTIINQCGVAVMIGEDPGSSSIGLSIDALYIEGGGTGEHIVVAHRFGNASNSHYIGSSYELDLSRCWGIGDPRVTAGTINGGTLGSGSNLTALTIGHKGVLRSYMKGNLNQSVGSTTNLYGQTTPPVPQIIRKDTVTLNLNVVGSGEYNRLFGYSGGIVGILGTGTNGAPSGTVTFAPPSGGTINGGAVDATVAYTGLTEPGLFLYEHTDTAQLTWLVRPISGQALTTSSALTPASVASTGAVTSSSGTAGMGYATGSGGSVTQATSKSTGVTLNKVCGKVTMNAAALAAAAKVSFVVTNSTVAATDVIVANVVSGGTANAYRAEVTAVAPGSFTVTVENITAGSLSEAPVIGFAVMKAVTA